jgi:mono/diheme cytochrome c family protein
MSVIGNLLTFFILIAIIVGLFYLARRAWGSHSRPVKWVGTPLAGILGLLVALITIVGGYGMVLAYQPRPNLVHEVKIDTTPERVARGAKLANFCAGCHSTTGKPPLDGSAVNFGDQPGSPPLGSLYPPNLTPAGPLRDWSDGEIIRAVREGVHKTGRTLIIMPAESFHNLSDEDVQSVVAFLRSQPAVQHDLPDLQGNFAAMLILGAGMYPPSVQPPISQPILAPPKAETPEFGKYIVSISDCRICHGNDLGGGDGKRAFTPIGPNLTAIVPNFTRNQFIQTIRTGTDPTGHSLNPDLMPWKVISATFDDQELGAVYAYIKSLPPVNQSAQK